VIRQKNLIKTNLMPNTIAEYYTDELLAWIDSIHFYTDEMNGVTQKSEEVVRRNSIEDIANKVEAQQALLNRVADKFYRLQIEIQQQRLSIQTDSTFIEDKLINIETEKRQNELRRKMQHAEKEYVDAKYECQGFLSRTLKK